MMFPVHNLAIVVPLKGFAVAKTRLRVGGVSDVDEVARSLARQVLLASAPRPLYVACESRDVADFAQGLGAKIIESRSHGLNQSLTNAYRLLGEDFERIIIAHGDLRDPRGLGDFEPLEGITIVTDESRTGTNVLALPTGLDFQFHFGIDSAPAHEREASRFGVDVHVVFDSPWRFDVDEPSDINTK
jgi:2-phospho-L-lactate guanylyltransferase (CobY/MobA/RfbA family)